jgi:hypothetical protein
LLATTNPPCEEQHQELNRQRVHGSERTVSQGVRDRLQASIIGYFKVLELLSFRVGSDLAHYGVPTRRGQEVGSGLAIAHQTVALANESSG